MPRYLFGWLEGDDAAISDDKQIDFPDFDAAQVEARRALAERSAERGPDRTRRSIGIAVRDENGNYLMRKYAPFKTEP